MVELKRVQLDGFRSIRSAEVNFRALNIMIGANGAGKSNFVAFFKMMNEMMGGRLQQYISTSGRAQSNLYLGPKVTPQMSAQLEFETETGLDTYYMRLFHAAGDSLVFAEERLSFRRTGWPRPQEVSLGPGHQETQIGDLANQGNPVARTFRHLLNNCRVFHFHDTSQTAHVRQYHYVGNHRFLMPDAANLAPVLYRWKQEHEPVYRRIVKTIQQVAPFFEGFELEPERNSSDIILNWRHKKSDFVFGPHQLSDGTLRAICIISLLLQPEDELPNLIVVDEPELGLHPYAL
ncbi:MAG TPA: AAA family ATPase, partial [Anaerolineales bacterium]|nr:AAA family ATPase [Anaerolineales bacterium]